MKYSLTLAVAGFLLPVVLASPQAADSPCGDCGDLERKETDCTTPERGLQEHAECMCGNNFFTEWRKCRTCLFNVEQTPQEIYNDSMQAIKKVEYYFCEAKQPQALFQQAFNNALGNPESMPALGVNSVSSSPSTPGETASASAQDSAGFPSTSGSVRPTITTAFSSAISLTASTTSGTGSHSTSSSSSSGGSRITPGTGRNSTVSGALPTGAAVPAVQAATGLAMALGAAALIGL